MSLVPSHLHRHSTSPPPPPPTRQPLIFSSIVPSSIDQPPQSWLEMGLSGHSLTFSFHLDNQEIIMDLQNPGYVAQIITEGMRLGIEAYINHMNIPRTELPFYHPEQPEGPVLAPPIQSQINPPISLIEVPTSNPSSRRATHDNTPQIEQDTTPLPTMALQQGIRPMIISFRDRSMLDYYRPTMVLLLETQMIHRQHLMDDFSFSDIANVPAIEGCGGMALVWKKEFVSVDGLVINNEEIHCTINVQWRRYLILC
ncbi:hypothetical protein H5410_017933 [Solanum commersonii]|uniref:Uncharacterized protein n=1 Tax=Solanum commersonii TaxID=4109 RepID=A0A9J6A0K3_SOLCO|nr:hypothetical protein H5410_017933 [Solanum commersonii]